MDWNQINSWGNLLEHLMPPTRTVENSWNCLLLKERRNKEAIRQSSKNQRGCWDQLDNKQTDLVLHARERQDKERRKKGEGVSKSKKGGWVWNQREPQMGARGWETRGDSDCRANKRTWEEREGLRGQRFSRRMKGCKQSPLSCFCKPSAASLLHLLQFCSSIALAPIASAFVVRNNAAFCQAADRREDDEGSKSDSKMQLLSSRRKDTNWLWQKCIYIGVRCEISVHCESIIQSHLHLEDEWKGQKGFQSNGI